MHEDKDPIINTSEDSAEAVSKQLPWSWLDPDSSDFNSGQRRKYDKLQQFQPTSFQTLEDALGADLVTTLATQSAEQGPSVENVLKIDDYISAHELQRVTLEMGEQWVLTKEMSGVPTVIILENVEEQDKAKKFKAPRLRLKKLLIKDKNGQLTDLISFVPSKVRVFFSCSHLLTPSEGIEQGSRDNYFDRSGTEIVVSSLETLVDLATFLHEVGHALDNETKDPQDKEIPQSLIKFFDKYVLTGQQLYLDLFMQHTRKLKIEKIDIDNAAEALRTSERVASAWSTNTLQSLLRLDKSQLETIISRFEEAFRTYDTLYSTKAAVSKEQSDVSIKAREKAAFLMLWLQDVFHDLASIDMPYGTKREITVPLMDGAYSAQIKVEEIKLSVYITNTATGLHEGVYFVSPFFAHFINNSNDSELSPSTSIELFPLKNIEEYVEPMVDGRLDEFADGLRQAVTEAVIQIEDQSLAQLEKIRSILGGVMDFTEIDPVMIEQQYGKRPYQPDEMPSDLIHENFETTAPYFRLQAVYSEIARGLANILGDPSLRNNQFDTTSGKKIETKQQLVLYLLNLILEDPLTRLGATEEEHNQRKEALVQFKEYLAHLDSNLEVKKNPGDGVPLF